VAKSSNGVTIAFARYGEEAVGMRNRQGESYESFRVDVEQSHRVSEVTIAYY